MAVALITATVIGLASFALYAGTVAALRKRRLRRVDSRRAQKKVVALVRTSADRAEQTSTPGDGADELARRRAG
jgi:hypothetical protein